MKVTVDISDEWIEGGDLSAELVRAIKSSIVADMILKTRDETRKIIAEEVIKTIHAQINAEIQKTISEFVDTGMILVSGKEISITDHMKNVFVSNHGWSNPGDKMAALAKTFGEDLKKQYNAIFATKIVMNMHEQGFLKDDMAQILIGKDK